MIAGLQGKVVSLGGDWVVVDVHGVHFKVHVATSTAGTLGHTGEEVSLYTHLHIREDNVTLYGFTSVEEQGLFQVLLGVSGLGPKLALAMLSVMTVEQLTTAIVAGNAELLTRIPGIGKKMAQRLLLELKEKLAAGWIAVPAAQVAQEDADVITALTTLGYSISEASRAVASLPSTDELSLEEKVRQALQYFTAK